jgi:hypothetical protein
MPKYHFIKYKEQDNCHDFSTIIYEVDSHNLEEVIEGFENFLKASGFYFEGHLYITDDDEAA